MADIANIPNGTRADGKWVRCGGCSKAYWGLFRPTAFIADKFQAHLAKAHKAPQAPVEVGADAPAADARPEAKAEFSDHADFVPAVIRQAQAAQRLAAKKAHDPLADIALELDPRLQLAQGPRFFPDEGGDRIRKVRDHGKGQDVMARVQADLSPLRGWA